MSPGLVDAALAGGALAVYAAAYAVVLVVTRPARVRASAATPELGHEPPAVVSLLANRWRLTDDASESTLLDLAARGYLELRQPGNDSRQTTIHLRRPDQAGPLTPYERRVRDRVVALAVDGVMPVQPWRSRSRREGRRTWLEYLAIDDGTADRVTAWGLTVGTVPYPDVRDVVTVWVRPWTRRVVRVLMVEHGGTHRLTDAPVAPPDGRLRDQLRKVIGATASGPAAHERRPGHPSAMP